jgi:ribonuclease HI
MNTDSVIIFTDGSSRGNPGSGGWGAIVIQNGRVVERGGAEKETTNNRMELTAAIEGLRTVQPNRKERLSITVHCDSSYVINGITKWIFGWRKNGWLTKAKTPVENRDLWERLSAAAHGQKVEWTLVGGHIGIAGNERCDEIATAFADGGTPNLYDGALKKYPVKNILEISLGAAPAAAKSSASASRRHTAYSYTSLVRGKIMTHKTWAECEARVRGASGARYKKALNQEEEQAIKKEFGAADSL